MVAGAVNGGEVQIAVKVEESLGNCPKYLNKKDVTARDSIEKGRVEKGLPLGEGALEVVRRADMVFLTSGYEGSMDTNHRGGSRGFVRVARNDAGGVDIIYPSTLGNLKENPLVGVAIPDFETSDVLYLTGSASILVGKDAAAHLPHTKLAVKITVAAAVFVESGLPFVGTPLEASPYNPPVRRLLSEQQHTVSSEARTGRTATLLRREWEAGQYVTLDFSEELDVGWSHMRDDEPQSLNDDYVRTFTVSCPPGDGKEVEITARRKGPVTDMLWRWNPRVPLEIPVLGFGGEEAFRLGRREGDGVEEVFVAAGVGITPLLAQAGGVLGTGGRVKVFWSVRGQDLKLVREVCGKIDGLGGVLRAFVTGRVGEAEEEAIREIEALGATVERRRLGEGDVKDGAGKKRFFLCTGPEMLKVLNVWLEGEEVAWEDFAF
ncbi:hypothetical protein ColLi_13874 [Colletotrichum liriopes]|uniref:FAD-binding FR-type domain-containing protein n=1 Tax=Colletotrichum liriopes TaxID=708192 RepID=A0AA37H118_9PEZI|nr:hypothetical protein ColLi_13874 [Colletotrichum liriopes]